ncbi:MAG TPA: prenyltransferase/squalene oxidase repeat-containing protein [Tepidisphaeraceae bacterium]|jgi:hypothetical protein|nr:prenyltransferase/squalene oxidase repeat-containing protein [Tepidisphaeraceae bacterium]
MRFLTIICLLLSLSGCQSPSVIAIQRGVTFLEQSQQPEGFWGTGLETRGLEIYSMVPGSHDAFRVATTSLCIMALRQAGETQSHDKAVEWLLAHGDARRDDGSILYNIWAHIYATHALALEMRYNHDPRIARAAQWHMGQMAHYATYAGGWNYYDFDARTELDSMGATSFGTAAGLVALYEARKSGLDVPQRMIDLAEHRLEDARLPNGVFLYGSDYKYMPQLPANMARGAVGRTQPANLALMLWDSKKVDDEDALSGLKLFWDDHVYLEMGRKRPEPHEAWYQTSGYYFYFDHFYASLLIDRLKRTKDAKKMVEMILQHQEPDGSWWDYAMWDYHKPYGTAFAVMTLLNSEHTMAGR